VVSQLLNQVLKEFAFPRNFNLGIRKINHDRCFQNEVLSDILSFLFLSGNFFACVNIYSSGLTFSFVVITLKLLIFMKGATIINSIPKEGLYF
jgi:hypothetical protein